MGFNSQSEIFTQLVDVGDFHIANVFKPALTNGGGTLGPWYDTSVASGTPKYNAYPSAPLLATQLVGSGNSSIYPGTHSSDTKNLLTWAGRSLLGPATMILCDYLMYYALIDIEDTGSQDMDNAVSLPRYTDGKEVRAMIVSTTVNSLSVTGSMEYIDSSDVQRTCVFGIYDANAAGYVINTGASTVTIEGYSPFLSTPNGIKRVISVTLNAAGSGFCTLVLVKPITTLSCPEATTWTEISFIADKFTLPKILPGAFLQILMKSQAVGTNALMSRLEFINK
jgi:hypothetical protein